MVLDIDLNHPLSTVENMDDRINLSLSINSPGNSRTSQTQTVELDLSDDEVIVCSPRSFAEAREKARRNREVVEVINDESVLQREGNNGQRRERPKATIPDGVDCINLEDSESPKAKSSAMGLEKSQSVPPEEPSFSCPVCLGPLAEETSTRCGHIFCKECIYKAVVAQKKCPTCRKKLKAKDLFRIYLRADY